MSLVEDHHVAELLLRAATVPVQITLASQDVTSATPPLPLFVNVPRASLLAALHEHIVAMFLPSIADFGTPPPVWLERDTTPPSTPLPLAAAPSASGVMDVLPWHVPVGAVVDSLAARVGAHAVLPFRIVAHMSPPPPRATVWLLTNAHDATIMAQHCLKQALMGRYRELRPFYKAKKEHIDCYVAGALAMRAHESAQRAEFESVLEGLFKYGRQLCAENNTTPKLPVIVHRGSTYATVLLDTPVTVREERSGAASASVHADPMSKEAPNTEAPTTAADLTQAPPLDFAADTSTTACAHLATLTLAHALALALTDAERAEAGCNLGPYCPLVAPPAEPLSHPRLEAYVVGTRPLLCTPLSWAMQHLTYADLALHIVVVPKA